MLLKSDDAVTLLKKLSEINGTSGHEKAVRDTLGKLVEPLADSVMVDRIGNLIASKKGHRPGPKILLAAHMDEVALMVTEITADGFLKFRPVGGIDPRILVSKPVRIKEIAGVIGAKAIHLQKAGERQKALSIDQLYIDIGARSKEDALKHVELGDYAYFQTVCEPLGDGFWKGKAFDDRAGCAVLVEILKRDYDLTVTAAFTVQEEVGLRGAKVAAFHTEPDFAVVVEGTVAADTLDREDYELVTELGQGAVCSVMDNTTLYNPKLIRSVAQIAEQAGIPFQLRRGTSGGNDAGRIHLTRAGVPTVAISVPCRYIHSTASIIAEQDYLACIELVDRLVRAVPVLLVD